MVRNTSGRISVYTVFINSLINDLKHSGLCCKIYMIPSMPVGYADDLATCSTSKYKLEQAIDVVAAHGRTWRYNFNAKKSGILVYGEERSENLRNANQRVFKLGCDKVAERDCYDHVGIRATIHDYDTTGLEERISKARRTLNAISGLGIRRCGLTILTCNVIFWSIIVPIATYGCELLVLTDNHINILEEFQEYAGRKIQRFYTRTSKVCSFYALGWVHLERFVEIRKILFIRNILALDDNEPIKIVFRERAMIYFEKSDEYSDNIHRSPTVDLLQTAQNFGMLDVVRDMILTGNCISKPCWKRTIWARAWDLETIFWTIQSRSHESLMFLDLICHSPRYLIWWSISDRHRIHG